MDTHKLVYFGGCGRVAGSGKSRGRVMADRRLLAIGAAIATLLPALPPPLIVGDHDVFIAKIV